MKEVLQGLQIFRATGAKIGYTFIISAWRTSFCRDGNTTGRERSSWSLQEVGPKTERVFHAELLRLQGLICLREAGERGFRRNRDALAEDGERHLRDAIAVAREQNARAFLLRATSDLCRLLRGRGDHYQAQRLLEGQGVEAGLEPADWDDAKKLLLSAAASKRQTLRPAPV